VGYRARGCVILGAVALCSVGSADAQQRRQQPIADTADQIARETWPVERGRQTEEGITIFRTETRADADAFRLPPPWLNDQRMGPRMDGLATHRERLMMTTPVAYRGSVLYPATVGIDPALIVNGVKSAWRRWQEHRVRERIQKEVDALGSHVTDEPGQGN
jgi:hypothetical protein